VGDCFDHALIESFFATLECELIDQRHWHTRDEARLEVFWWIEAVYNRTRRHSRLGVARSQGPVELGCCGLVCVS
jgi:putative transposase